MPQAQDGKAFVGLAANLSTCDSELGKRLASYLASLPALGNKVSLPGSSAYLSSLQSYFSLQEAQVQPCAVVSPTSTEDVSAAVKAISHYIATSDPSERPHVHFAVRSGGHGPFAGIANAANGVTIDLRGLNGIEVSSDKSTVSVGVGSTWGAVYSKLDALNLSVAGGRAAQVGVGGLTLGGGVSYFSPRYGWACDSVRNFEVVLADGSIVNANSDQNADLAFALRGSSNNFGIVTKVDLAAFPQGDMWGGSVYYALSTAEQHLEAFVAFNSAENYDEYASLILSFGFAAGQGAAVVNSIEYTKPIENPPAFQPFTQIPSLQNTLRITNVTDISTEQGSFQPDGSRQFSIETTYKSELPILQETLKLWNASLESIQNVTGIVWSLSLDPLPPAIYARAAEANALGFSSASGPFVICQLTGTWSDETDDKKVNGVAKKLFEDIDSAAKRLGSYHPFVYLNYAAPWQDPITSYGSESVERLKRISKAVDPEGLFQRNVPGGFKLPR